jgi:hypothetical protein
MGGFERIFSRGAVVHPIAEEEHPALYLARVCGVEHVECVAQAIANGSQGISLGLLYHRRCADVVIEREGSYRVYWFGEVCD